MSFKKKGEQMIVGYARVSTSEQNISLQKEELKKYGAEKIFEDKISGSKKDRPGLNKMMEMIREGDTLIIWKLDRLGRSLKNLIEFVSQLNERGIHLKSITDSIDTSTASGKFFFHIMAALAEMEGALIRERTRVGLEAARRQGRFGGRKPLMTDSKLKAARKLLKSGELPRDVVRNLGVSLATLYRWIPAAQTSSS